MLGSELRREYPLVEEYLPLVLIRQCVTVPLEPSEIVDRRRRSAKPSLNLQHRSRRRWSSSLLEHDRATSSAEERRLRRRFAEAPERSRALLAERSEEQRLAHPDQRDLSGLSDSQSGRSRMQADFAFEVP